jgi:hypothetical protein
LFALDLHTAVVPLEPLVSNKVMLAQKIAPEQANRKSSVTIPPNAKGGVRLCGPDWKTSQAKFD